MELISLFNDASPLEQLNSYSPRFLRWKFYANWTITVASVHRNNAVHVRHVMPAAKFHSGRKLIIPQVPAALHWAKINLYTIN